MARVYKSICMEIDDLTVKLMHLCEKLTKLKLEMVKTMHDGFLNIAKARYVMGSKCVSTLQLPTKNSNPFPPLATVCRILHNGSWIFKIHRIKQSPISSEEKIIDKGHDDPIALDVVKGILEKDSNSMRKRKEFYLVDDNNYKELNDELQDEISLDSYESKELPVTFTDPIRLFGVFVPQTLRTAQKNFQEAVDVIPNCATVQTEIHKLITRYSHLKKVKSIIESAAVERGIDLTEEKNYWSPSEKSIETSKGSDQITSDESEVREEDTADSELAEEEVELEVEGEEGQIYITAEDG